MMNAATQNDLLATLQLDREPPRPTRGRSSLSTTLLVSLLTALAAWGYVQLSGPSSVLVPHADAGFSNTASSPMPVSEATPEIAPPASAIVLQATGYVTARQAATVSARTTAVVNAIYVEEGDYVTAGSVLARLEDRLQRAQYELAKSEQVGAAAQAVEVGAELAAAERHAARVAALAMKNLASEAELDSASSRVEALNARFASLNALSATAAQQIEVRRVALQDYVIRAPFDGVVTERSAQAGEIVSPMSAGGSFTRTGIATVVNMASLEVEVDVSETYIGQVRADNPVAITLAAYPQFTYTGKVATIIPKGDRNKGTVRVRVEIADKDERILPDMGVRVDFLSI